MTEIEAKALKVRAAEILAGRAARYQELVAAGAPPFLIAKEERLIARAIAIWTLAGAGLQPDESLESEFMQDALKPEAGSGGDERVPYAAGLPVPLPAASLPAPLPSRGHLRAVKPGWSDNARDTLLANMGRIRALDRRATSVDSVVLDITIRLPLADAEALEAEWAKIVPSAGGAS